MSSDYEVVDKRNQRIDFNEGYKRHAANYNAKLAAGYVCVCGEPLRGRKCNCAFAALPDDVGAVDF